MIDLFSGLDAWVLVSLLLALAFVLAFEFINGFHDTANAVATVIYTKAMPPHLAVFFSGVFNFLGVLLGGVGVAYAIVHLLPVELLINVNTGHGLAMVFSLLAAAITWNLGTWYFGIPASSSHTLIGSILGVGLANALINDIPLADDSWGCDLEAEVVVVTGDVPQGASREQALAAIRLVGLTNDVSLRNLIPGELAKGFGFFQSKPASAFSPVFVTPDALGEGWRDGKLHRTLMVDLNGQPFGRVAAGEDMTFDFGTLIAHAAKTRALGAGTIVGSGTVSNRDADGGPGRPIGEGGVGYCCLAEVRTVETIRSGAAVTPFLKRGDVVRIWAEDDRHHPIFGVIEQAVA